MSVAVFLQNGTTPIFIAVECNKLEIVKKLLQKNANSNAIRVSLTYLFLCI